MDSFLLPCKCTCTLFIIVYFVYFFFRGRRDGIVLFAMIFLENEFERFTISLETYKSVRLENWWKIISGFAKNWKIVIFGLL